MEITSLCGFTCRVFEFRLLELHAPDYGFDRPALHRAVRDVIWRVILRVATQTKNGYPAEVTSIDLTDTHCPGGLGRGTGEGCNLNNTTPEMADVVEVAKRLGAGFTTNHTFSVPVRRLRAVTG